jgi:predicted dehydrogenase
MDTLKVGIIGGGWMGHVHARAYRRVKEHWADLPLRPEVAAVAETVPEAAADFRARFGTRVYPNWRDLVADPDIRAVSVTAPNYLHREMGVAVAEAGKHLWIEKPVGLDAEDAIAVRDAVQANGVVGCVGFNYRQVPAVSFARELIESGAIGRVTHARAQLFSDYAAHPGSPLSWRFAMERGGHGVLGDLASHGVDLLRYLLGDIDSLVAQSAVHVPHRPIAEVGSPYAVMNVEDPDLTYGDVENEDYIVALLRMQSGVLALCEANRAAVGEQNNYAFEVHGTKGLVRWDFRRSDELQLSTGDDYSNQPTQTIFAGPGHGEFGAFHPGAGIAMGYDDTKVVEAMLFVRAIAGDWRAQATLDDAVASAVALDAMVDSAATGAWVSLG